jgi:hypothetical protein
LVKILLRSLAITLPDGALADTEVCLNDSYNLVLVPEPELPADFVPNVNDFDGFDGDGDENVLLVENDLLPKPPDLPPDDPLAYSCPDTSTDSARNIANIFFIIYS